MMHEWILLSLKILNPKQIDIWFKKAFLKGVPQKKFKKLIAGNMETNSDRIQYTT